MTYSSITTSIIISPLRGTLSWQAPQRPWFDREIKTRFYYLLAGIGLGIYAPVVDTIVGLSGCIGVFLTLGTVRHLNRSAFTHLNSSGHLASLPYTLILSTINPKALNSTIGSNIKCTEGFAGKFIIPGIQKIAENCSKSQNFLERHVASRLTYALALAASVITRVADIIIAALAIPLSLITLGAFGSLNNVAYRASGAPGSLIWDITICTLKIINPWAEI